MSEEVYRVPLPKKNPEAEVSKEPATPRVMSLPRGFIRFQPLQTTADPKVVEHEGAPQLLNVAHLILVRQVGALHIRTSPREGHHSPVCIFETRSGHIHVEGTLEEWQLRLIVAQQ